ncbi:hypothetical protein PMIN01_01526 [Paraphaeosphaeria minitans]|uniref:Antifungal protein n=1 Tax=Paraphaeosphaeria minitans TaxID=565426 RepID=A0A9P6GUB5_9PLEO|nr:hypothetical protein PMIN01_01526 [Paraphaeosphaeria minitans]
MFSKTIIAATFTALFATSAIGATQVSTHLSNHLQQGSSQTDPRIDAACNCPNNCKHNNGDSCSFYRDGNQLDGECQHTGEGGRLLCVA